MDRNIADLLEDLRDSSSAVVRFSAWLRRQRDAPAPVEPDDEVWLRFIASVYEIRIPRPDSGSIRNRCSNRGRQLRAAYGTRRAKQ